MAIDLFTVRNFKTVSGLAFCWQCCRQRLMHLHRTINAGFASATF